jgi:peptide methionine sulfoxide reductase msrA/msrB
MQGTKRGKAFYGLLLLTAAMTVLAMLAACSEKNRVSGRTTDKTYTQKEETMKYHTLTAEEEQVIIGKGTERPFTGKYYLNKDKGVYLCKRCDAELFRSDDKFESGTGWPSFDDAIPGAVKKIPDPDGSRTEIVCANCNAHLGHVFYDEGFTDKNARYCVNSISLLFTPKAKTEKVSQKAIFAGGCFWGMEYHFNKTRGVLGTKVGYTGGTTEHPTYKQVCSDRTGHAEAIEVEFDPSVVTYESLAKLFFEIHDPTQVNRQGPDVGSQYRSAVFYVDEEQKLIAESLIEKLKEKGYRVATEVVKAGTFWEAEDYHQDYYEKTGHQPYCHIYQKRF